MLICALEAGKHLFAEVALVLCGCFVGAFVGASGHLVFACFRLLHIGRPKRQNAINDQCLCYILKHFEWSGRWESNPRDQLGRLEFYH